MNFTSIRFTIYTVLLLSVFISCGTDDDGGSGGDDEFIRASVEMLDFESSDVANGTTVVKIENEDNTLYLLQGIDNDGNAMVLSVANYQGTGTYDFGIDQEDAGTLGQFSNQETVWTTATTDSTASGFITVLTDDDDETTGTFEFVGVEIDGGTSTRTVTNGSFRARFE